MMKSKTCKNKRVLFVLVILIFLSSNIFLINLNKNQNLDISNQNSNTNIDFQNKDLKIQDLASDNTYTGIGAPWNVTHWANRTDSDLTVSFTNDSYDIVEMPLGSGWEGYKLNSYIRDLYETRNWNNGSFSFGDDDTTYTAGEDDTDDVINNFQNWTFGYYDAEYLQPAFSGNYLDESAADSGGHDCLELRIDGDSFASDYWYDTGDSCWWNSSVTIPRGRVIDSELQFDVRPYHLMDFNDFELRFYFNDILIYTIGAFNMKQQFEDSWGSYKIPQGLWINTSHIFTNPVENSALKINVSLYDIIGAGYGSGFENCEYQQLFIDNIKLITKTEVKPSQINLKTNSTYVDDIEWGKGTAEIEGNWQSNKVYINFSSEAVVSDIYNSEYFNVENSSYKIDLKTDLNLYALKNTPETNYETNVGSLGTSFSIINSSPVNWELYSYFSVPNGYEETEMRLDFTPDVNITWVSEPQDPSMNRLNLTDYSTPGLLIIPVETISTTPDGFWKFEAISPNYCEQLDIRNNATGTWNLDNEFLSGDYINITAKITDSPLISGHILQTKAQLNIRFPNGTLWSAQSQLKTPDINGFVYFDYFQIPTSPPNYEVGEYEAIVTWNNSYSTYGLNETGIIYKKFIIIHESILTPDENYYEDISEGEVINLKVSFNDLENFDAIQDAELYLDNFLDSRQFFSEISPGYYFIEFNTTGGIAGINTLTIYANSSLYTNTQVNISVELILELIVQPIGFEDTIDAEMGETIIIQLQLLDPNTNNSIENASITYSWRYGVDSINQTSPGMYQAVIILPDNVKGNYKFELTIIPENSTYRTTQYSFIVVISEPIVVEDPFPSFLLWIIIGVLVIIVSALGFVSLRTYVFMPRKRRKESELLSKTQRFKDINNIQAIVVIHKLSGIPLYSKSYSILEKHKKELFSGFIQAITTIGEEFSEKEITEIEPTELEKSYGAEKVIELDFKQFYCLITDIEDIRVVFILKEKSSERLKSQVSNLALALNLKLSKELEMWNGALDDFEMIIPKILNEYFELYYKDSFKLVGSLNLIKLKKERALSKMEMRVINVVQSMSKDTNIIVNLNNIVELISEENKDLVIEAIESLIRQNIIISTND
ncbi:MAG: hypothetical protein ACFE9X_01245 [Promethearchaeota archaeon]